jgi:hypothetical protein
VRCNSVGTFGDSKFPANTLKSFTVAVLTGFLKQVTVERNVDNVRKLLLVRVLGGKKNKRMFGTD